MRAIGRFFPLLVLALTGLACAHAPPADSGPPPAISYRFELREAPTPTLQVTVTGRGEEPVVKSWPIPQGADAPGIDLRGSDLPRPASWRGVERVAFQAKGFDAQGWSWIASFHPHETSFVMPLRPEQLARGLIVAGKVRVRRQTASGVSLVLVRDRSMSDALFEEAGALVKATRKLAGAPREGESWFVRYSAARGTGEPATLEPVEGGAWAIRSPDTLSTASDAGFSLGLARVILREELASESPMLHGAARLLGRRAAFQAKLLSLEGFIDDLNWSVERSVFDDASERPPSLQEALTRSQVTPLGPPERRAELAMLKTDWQLEQETQGGESLADSFRRALELAREEQRPAADPDLLTALGSSAIPALADKAWGFSLPSSDNLMVVGIYAPCLKPVLGARGPLEMGFDYAEAVRSRVIRGVVPGSRAEKAGLREGQTIVQFVLGATPHSPLTVTVRDAQGEREITYTPIAQSLMVTLFGVGVREACPLML